MSLQPLSNFALTVGLKYNSNFTTTVHTYMKHTVSLCYKYTVTYMKTATLKIHCSTGTAHYVLMYLCFYVLSKLSSMRGQTHYVRSHVSHSSTTISGMPTDKV